MAHQGTSAIPAVLSPQGVPSRPVVLSVRLVLFLLAILSRLAPLSDLSTLAALSRPLLLPNLAYLVHLAAHAPPVLLELHSPQVYHLHQEGPGDQGDQGDQAYLAIHGIFAGRELLEK